MSELDEQISANQRLWDVWTGLHLKSDVYDMDSFRAGRNSLTPVERQELGNVAGKRLVHLQCHFGQDTLSWARLGADVTGLDFSQKAIATADRLATELNIPARFVRARVEDAVATLGTGYDIVFMSYGVLSWLADLDAWAANVAGLLRPGGVFYIVELHPMLGMFDEEGKTLAYPYFSAPEPLRLDEEQSYTGHSHSPLPAYQWSYGIGEIISALARAGMRISFVNEHPTVPFPCYPFLIEDEAAPGCYVMRDHRGVPLLFSIHATRSSALR